MSANPQALISRAALAARWQIPLRSLDKFRERINRSGKLLDGPTIQSRRFFLLANVESLESSGQRPGIPPGTMTGIDLAERWGVSRTEVYQWRRANKITGHLTLADVQRFELQNKHPVPNQPPESLFISRRALVARWKVSVSILDIWSSKNPGLARSVRIKAVKYFRVADIERVEAQKLQPEYRRVAHRYVRVEGVKYCLTDATAKFARMGGINSAAIRDRLLRREDCKLEWLLRPLQFRGAPKPEPTPAELKHEPKGTLLVDDTPMTPERAANYIARRSIRQRVVVTRVGRRISVLPESQAKPSPADIGTFHRATPAMVAEELAA